MSRRARRLKTARFSRDCSPRRRRARRRGPPRADHVQMPIGDGIELTWKYADAARTGSGRMMGHMRRESTRGGGRCEGRARQRGSGGCRPPLWRIGIMVSTLFKEDLMALDFDALSPEELLAAESAVLTMRSLTGGQGRSAWPGHGLRGVGPARQRLRASSEDAAGRGGVPRRGAKKGSAVCPVPAGKPPRSSGARPKTILSSVGHIAVAAAVLRLPALQGQADPLGKLGGGERHAPRHAPCPADDRAGRQRLLVRRGVATI